MLEHGELTTAVLRPRALVMPDDGRLLLTVALRLNAVRRNADRFEVGADRRGAEVAKREVVFVRAALVAVTLDDHDAAGTYAAFTSPRGGFAGEEIPRLFEQIFDSWLPTSAYTWRGDCIIEVLHLWTGRELRRENRYYEVWIPVELK